MLLVSDNWRLVSAVRKVEVDLLQLRFVVTQDSASEERAKIDHIWQKASTKYDTERAALLKEVDAIADQGPFRPDWESLQKYESPEWYQDAKFGIL